MNLTNGEYLVEINGIQHWVKIEGSEQETTPLVILHGGPGGNHYVFERTAGPLLSKSRTLVYYEQRGCGRSGFPVSENDYSIELLVKDFIEIMKWLKVERVDLLGYSFGGELALEIAYAHPESINEIILSGPSLMDLDIHKVVQIAGFLTVANSLFAVKGLEILGVEELYKRVWELASTEMVDALLFENQEIARKNRQWWEESKLRNTGLLAKGLQTNPVTTPLVSRLKGICNPVLIITGIFDRNTGIPVSKIIHGNLPDSRMVTFDRSAHFPDLEETDKFVEVINGFLIKRVSNINPAEGHQIQ
ncbi:alpha/beta fold hydrolase [Bacillus salacetis]|uniref:alpha/beta fold hydrolase n=1 Tax=Bacillus salacetis TaxID=2315464 RepID=UPI001F0B8A52|nr:alpha/beta hydrolase [Bacillus salacetis]